MAQKTPYTNYHDLNLDWIVKKIKSAINTAYNPDNPPPYPVTSVNGYAGAVQLDSKEIPYINGQPETVWDEVHKRYVKPASGIPAHDLAETYIESPAVAGNAGQVLTSDGHGSQSWQTPVSPDSIIDDNAGYGDTDKTWSADKLTQIEADIIDLQNDKLDAPDLAGTQGQVLTSDGNGSQTWEDIPPVVLDVSDNSPASIMTILDGADSLPMALEVEIAPNQDLHGYANPWPAGGGKNLLSLPSTPGHYVTAEGKVVMSGTASGNFDAYNTSLDLVTLYAGTTYTFSLQGDKKFRYKLYLYENGASYIEIGQLDTNYTKSYTPSQDIVISGFLLRATNGQTVDVDAYYMLEVGSSATSYAPYENICPITGWTECNVTNANGVDPTAPGYIANDYEISFPSSAGTVYGGTLTINKDGTGTLVVDRGYYTPAFTSGWTKVGTDSFSATRNDKVQAVDSAICSHFATTTYDSSKNILLNNTGCSSTTELANYQTTQTTAGTPIQIVYILANPTTYNLTAEQILSLFGVNIIYADTGDILSVDYSADIKLYIDSKFNSIVPAEGEGF